ncbi:MAG: hypothetical protein QG597_821 [Actinomycetota bacterium]|nr:hypothetical protein [Actinomycetota bacterium]
MVGWRGRWAGAIAVLAVPLAACAPNDAAIAASLAARPAEPSLPPAPSVSALGTEIWRIPLAGGSTRSFTVDHAGDTFLLAALPDDRPMEVIVGASRSGTVMGRFTLPMGSAWPVLLGQPAQPIIVAAVPTGDADFSNTVAGFDLTGARVWQVTAEQLGLPVGIGVHVDPSADGRVVVRSSPRPFPAYKDAALWLLDSSTGTLVWEPPGGRSVRWAEAADGLLMYTWRSDGDVDDASDRVTMRSLADGRELGTVEVINDFGGDRSLNSRCGGIVARDRVAICQWDGEQHAVLLADQTGAVIGTFDSVNTPVIDRQASVVVVDPLQSADGVLGLRGEDGAVLWRYSAADVLEYGFGVDVGRDGLLIGNLVGKNLAMSSRVGTWLVVDTFELIRSGASIGDVVIDVRSGDAVGYAARGVGVGILPDQSDRVLFVTP